MPPLPRLTRALVESAVFQRRSDIRPPAPELLHLPEKVVQFGTGALLRGLVDDCIDSANRRGAFGGRIVAVGSTGSGRDGSVNDQDGLFTLATSGIEGGAVRDDVTVIASVSRALSATTDWAGVLECARNPHLELVFSNTTEVGITLDESDAVAMAPPRSFPGKLTAFLFARAVAFAYDPSKGVVIIPCELIEHNGDRLRDIVTTLAGRWNLGESFAGWLTRSVVFCNTLVDRIVPGAPGPDRRAALDATLGYHDELLTTCERYRLFAIEGDESLADRLQFPAGDPGVVVTPSVTPYRTRKVRLLNGTHTIMTPVALLAGCETVLDAMQHELVASFIRRVMLGEIVPSLDVPAAASFAKETLDRFANPAIRHALFDITLHATMKMRVRIVPSLLAHVERTGDVPGSLAFGFAAHLLFMRGDVQNERQRAGRPVPPDDATPRLGEAWRSAGADHGALVRAVCADTALWGTDLGELPGFADEVTEHLIAMDRDGVLAALEAHLAAARPA